MISVTGIVSTILIAYSVLGIVANWWITIRNIMGRHDTLIPFVHGLAGALGLWLAPCAYLHAVWWFPMVVDLGTGPVLMVAIVEWVYRKARHKNRTPDE